MFDCGHFVPTCPPSVLLSGILYSSRLEVLVGCWALRCHDGATGLILSYGSTWGSVGKTCVVYSAENITSN